MEYIVKEYFCIENTLKLEGTAKKIVHRFAKLGGLMLNGWADVHRLQINADGLFYATYNAVADYISDNEMFAYGKKDNRTYNGEVTNEDAEYLLSLIEEMCEK